MRKTASVLGVLVFTAGMIGGTIAPASAAKTKTCSVETVVAGPGNSGMTQTVTETQTSACNSNSDTGYDIEEGPVTNRGGGTPGGQQ